MQTDGIDGISGVRQFAKMTSQMDLSEEEKPHLDPITAILSELGVQYTHLNMEIIGSSKVEARISEMAVSAAKDATRGDLRAYLSTHGVQGSQYKIG